MNLNKSTHRAQNSGESVKENVGGGVCKNVNTYHGIYQMGSRVCDHTHTVGRAGRTAESKSRVNPSHWQENGH